MQYDELSEESLHKAFGTAAAGVTLRVLDCVDSTNNEAKRMALDGTPTPAVIVAAEQTAGRGRMGRSFFSPADTGVYFSFLFRSESPAAALSLTGKAAVAVMRAIRRLTGKQAMIKWVNDLYFNGKKICGILTEALTVPGEPTAIIVGIGINLVTEDFPKELEAKAGSLGSAPERAALVAAVFSELQAMQQDEHEWLDDYRAASCVLGRPISWVTAGEVKHGRAFEINERGELSVLSEEGQTETLRTGEISVFLE